MMLNEAAADLVLLALLGDELEIAAFPYPPRVPFIGEHAAAFAASAPQVDMGSTVRPGKCS